MPLPFTDYTDNVVIDEDSYDVTGDGMFDDLMETVTKHVEAQFCNGRITGVDYATVYLGSMQAAMQTSAKIFLEREIAEQQRLLLEEQTALVTQQILESVAKTALIEAQTLTEAEKLLLVQAQTLGFKIDGKQLFAKAMETYAVFESVNKTGLSANPAEDANMTALYNEIQVLLGGTPI